MSHGGFQTLGYPEPGKICRDLGLAACSAGCKEAQKLEAVFLAGLLPPLGWGLGCQPRQTPPQLGVQQGRFPLQRARSGSWKSKTKSSKTHPLSQDASEGEGKSRQLDLEELITSSFLPRNQK